MKPLRTIVLSLSAIVVSAALLRCPQPATAQAEQTGWLEGTVVTDDGRVVNNPALAGPGGATIRVVRQGGGNFEVVSDYKMGGFFSLRNLKPGIYEVFISNGVVYGVKCSPQRIFGVVVKPGVRTVLNVQMQRGELLQEIGKPAVSTQPVTVIADELARLQKQIDELKRR